MDPKGEYVPAAQMIDVPLAQSVSSAFSQIGQLLPAGQREHATDFGSGA